MDLANQNIRLGLVLCIVSTRVALAQSEFRTWTDSTGMHSVEAIFVSLEDGVVRLEKKNGATSNVPLERLSSADQEYVKQLVLSQPTPPDSKATPASSADSQAELSPPIEQPNRAPPASVSPALEENPPIVHQLERNAAPPVSVPRDYQKSNQQSSETPAPAMTPSQPAKTQGASESEGTSRSKWLWGSSGVFLVLGVLMYVGQRITAMTAQDAVNDLITVLSRGVAANQGIRRIYLKAKIFLFLRKAWPVSLAIALILGIVAFATG